MASESAAPEPVYGKPFHGWSCECDECQGYDERGEPRPGEAPTTTAAMRDWPCTNPDHLGLCTDGHVHADHLPSSAAEQPHICCECVAFCLTTIDKLRVANEALRVRLEVPREG